MGKRLIDALLELRDIYNGAGGMSGVEDFIEKCDDDLKEELQRNIGPLMRKNNSASGRYFDFPYVDSVREHFIGKKY